MYHGKEKQLHVVFSTLYNFHSFLLLSVYLCVSFLSIFGGAAVSTAGCLFHNTTKLHAIFSYVVPVCMYHSIVGIHNSRLAVGLIPRFTSVTFSEIKTLCLNVI